MTSPDPRLGVVVLTHNRPIELARTLDHLAALPEQPRLVVVDNGSRPRVRPSSRGVAMEVVRLEDNRGAAARNVGVARLATPYVAFCGDDTWWAPGMLAHAADVLDAHPSVGLVTGKVLVGADEHIDPTCLTMAASPLGASLDGRGRQVLGFLCAASMVRRSAFMAVGGFEPRFFLGGEEALLAIDLAVSGFTLAYLDTVVVHHHPSPHRDAGQRRQLELRNALWCAWLRRPTGAAMRVTVRLVRRRLHEPALAPALLAALRGLPWVLRHRRVISPELEARLGQLEAA